MNLYEKYGVDPEKEKKGIPVPVEEATFYVRRMGGGNRTYRYALARAAEKNKTSIDEKDPMSTFEAMEKSLQDAFLDCCLVRWENVRDKDGNLMECTRSNAEVLFTECPEVWDKVRSKALDIENFRKDEVVELLGK